MWGTFKKIIRRKNLYNELLPLYLAILKYLGKNKFTSFVIDGYIYS